MLYSGQKPIKTNKNLHKVVSVTLEHITFIMSMNKASVYGSNVIQHAFEISLIYKEDLILQTVETIKSKHLKMEFFCSQILSKYSEPIFTGNYL